jgi:hypothetical protein
LEQKFRNVVKRLARSEHERRGGGTGLPWLAWPAMGFLLLLVVLLVLLRAALALK